MASLNGQNYNSNLYNIICFKNSIKTRLAQYVITAKNLFKTGIYTLEVVLLNLKKTYNIMTRYSSASLMNLWPTIRSTSSRHMGPKFSGNASDNYLITILLF